MPRNKEETEGLSLLGNKKTVYKDTYAPEVLETFVNKHQGNDYMVTFDCPEFTSLCPITGQPDFEKITNLKKGWTQSGNMLQGVHPKVA